MHKLFVCENELTRFYQGKELKLRGMFRYWLVNGSWLSCCYNFDKTFGRLLTIEGHGMSAHQKLWSIDWKIYASKENVTKVKVK